MLDLAIADLLEGSWGDDGGCGAGDLLDLAVVDLIEGSWGDDGGCSAGDLLELAVGDLLDDWNDHRCACSLLKLTITNLSGEGGGSQGESENDLLDGRHCER